MKAEALVREYRKNRGQIKKRLTEFAPGHGRSDAEIFEELCFCLLTPQSKALRCDEALSDLKRCGLLLNGPASAIHPKLKGRARFHNKKARYIVGARKLFKNGKGLDIKSRIDPADAAKTRDWLVGHIKGLGYKEASHFLRNIGLGKDLAILDRHILKNLKRFGAIDKVPASLGSRKIYLDLEQKAREFSRKIKVPLEELDLLFWSMETGHIFK